MKRSGPRPRPAPRSVRADRVVLGYRGPRRRSCGGPCSGSPGPRPTLDRGLGPGSTCSLRPGEEAVLDLAVACWRGDDGPEPPRFRRGAGRGRGGLRAAQGRRVPAPGVRRAVRRLDPPGRVGPAHADVRTCRPAPIPMPASPGSTPRSAATASSPPCECLWLRPELARGVLAYLAATQATEVDPRAGRRAGQDPARDPQRRDGGARGDAVRPLLRQRRRHAAVRAAGRGLLRADRRPAVRRGALAERRGRPRLDRPRTATATATGSSSTSGDRRDGLVHQGWKDSDDAVLPRRRHPGDRPDRPVRGPGIRLRRPAGRGRAGRGARACPTGPPSSNGQADRLRERFEAAFWCEDLGTYALALDGDKRPCRVRTSNAGHCLFGGHRRRRTAPRGWPAA